jgi:GT2 family glycosyltransferase
VSGVQVSVIVPAYHADATLAACLDSLLGQHFAGTYEVILSVSADTPDQLPVIPSDPRLIVLPGTPRMAADIARNRAARVAHGRYLAFTDADVVADSHWLEALVAASRDRCCVAGSVRNGTPWSAAGTAEYLLEFLDLHPARPARSAWHGATCNLLLPRSLWDQYGPFREDMEGGVDTFLTVRLRKQRLFVFAPRASVRHMNRSRLQRVLAHQYVLGQYAARLVRADGTKIRDSGILRLLVLRPLLAPLAVLARVISVYGRVAAWTPRLLPRAVALMPFVALALAYWGAGVAAESTLLGSRLRSAS